MKRTSTWALAALLVGGLPAQDAAPSIGAEAAYAKLTADFEAAKKEFNSRFDQLKNSDDWQQAMEARDNPALRKLYEGLEAVDSAAFAQRAMALAADCVGDDAVRFYSWVAINSGDRDLSKESIAKLRDDHLQSAGLEALLERGFMLGRLLGKDAGEMMLDLVIDENRHDIVRAWAMYWKAYPVLNRRGDGAGLSEDETTAAEELMMAAEKLAAGTSLAARIAAPRFEKERLQIGMTAPDIDGVDTDGTAFKLSDYRGKVVVLDFWGFW